MFVLVLNPEQFKTAQREGCDGRRAGPLHGLQPVVRTGFRAPLQRPDAPQR